jgi:hypothetical protein
MGIGQKRGDWEWSGPAPESAPRNWQLLSLRGVDSDRHWCAAMVLLRGVCIVGIQIGDTTVGTG